MVIAKISKEQLSKTVQISNAIEGYNPASKNTQSKVKKIMIEHNVKVSSKK